MTGPLRRADLHCHSHASRWKYLSYWANTRDSYNDPVALYHAAKQRGLDFVTISDHDTIDGCRELLDRLGPLDDFFVSEEVETWFPETRQRIHVNVFDITEAQHDELQRLRPDIRELAGYIRQEGILASVNHMFQNYRMSNDARRYLGELVRMFGVFEVRNGTMTPAHNQLVADVTEIVQRGGGRISLVGGSDAHDLVPVGCTATVAAGDTPREYLQSIRAGRCFVEGREMGFLHLLGAVYGAVGRHLLTVLDLADRERTALEKIRHLTTTALTVPVHMTGFPAWITALNYLKQQFVARAVGPGLVRSLESELAGTQLPVEDAVNLFAHLEELLIHRWPSGALGEETPSS